MLQGMFPISTSYARDGIGRALVEGLVACADAITADDSGLLRGERGILCQVWVQEGGARDGALLWPVSFLPCLCWEDVALRLSWV